MKATLTPIKKKKELRRQPRMRAKVSHVQDDILGRQNVIKYMYFTDKKEKKIIGEMTRDQKPVMVMVRGRKIKRRTTRF